VHLVGKCDAERSVVVDGGEVGDIRGLALAPAPRVVRVEAVRAGFDEVGDTRAEPRSDAIEHRSPSGILGRVVEQRGDRLVLVAPVLEHEPRDDEQVGEVGDLRSHPPLVAVQLVGERDGGQEAGAQVGWRASRHRARLRTGRAGCCRCEARRRPAGRYRHWGDSHSNRSSAHDRHGAGCGSP
jgi:hypothetical protein